MCFMIHFKCIYFTSLIRFVKGWLRFKNAEMRLYFCLLWWRIYMGSWFMVFFIMPPFVEERSYCFVYWFNFSFWSWLWLLIYTLTSWFFPKINMCCVFVLCFHLILLGSFLYCKSCFVVIYNVYAHSILYCIIGFA